MILQRKLYVGGVLTDATSVTLADPTGAFGVRRTDTNAVVVASGTAMVHDGTGLYSYTFTDPAAGLQYEYWMTIVYAGATYRVQKFATAPGGGASILGTMPLSILRKIARQSARNAGDTTYYPTYLVDLAIQRAADQLIREAHLCLRTDTEPTVANQASYSSPTGFRCDRLDSAWLTGSNVVVNGGYAPRYEYKNIRGGSLDGGYCYETARLELVDYPQLNDLILATAEVGQPRMIAFQNDGTYVLFPTPDQVYYVNLRWSDFFTTFKIGVPLTSVTLAAGAVTAVTIIDPSDNQGTTLTAAFVGGGAGTLALGTCTLNNGGAGTITFSGGAGYTSTPALYLGGADSTDRVSNLPDDLMVPVLTLGAPSFLCFADPEKKFAQGQAEAWAGFVAKVKGSVGGLSVKRTIRR